MNTTTSILYTSTDTNSHKHRELYKDPNDNSSEFAGNILITSDDDSEEDYDSDNSGEDEEDEDTTWISWFCSFRGNEFFCEVDEEYIQDDFNLTGLRSMMPQHYEAALDLILDQDSENENLSEENQDIIASAAETLYGLIHARYILTTRGLKAMLEKYKNAEFGRCARVLCAGAPVLPVGQVDVLHQNTVKLYCPKCGDIYYPKLRRHANIDGAYFGTTFPHLLLQTYPEIIPPRNKETYVPRIYGFKIHPSASGKRDD